MDGLRAADSGAGGWIEHAVTRQDAEAVEFGPIRPGFQSILYSGTASAEPVGQCAEPDFARDLNLDQIITAVTRGYEYYDLTPYFYRPLRDATQIGYRQAVMRDLSDGPINHCISAFSDAMRGLRRNNSSIEKMYYGLQKEKRLVESVEIYIDGVRSLAGTLAELPLVSSGMMAFRNYLADYVESSEFQKMDDDARRLTTDLSQIRYTILIRGDTVIVRDYAEEADYSEQVAETFARFRQDAVRDYLTEYHDDTNINHIEAQILDQAAKLHPATFGLLWEFFVTHREFVDPIIRRFDREIQFYISYINYIDRIKENNLPLCFPEIATDSKEVFGYEVFDLALASKLAAQGLPVVTNDFALVGEERVIVISGPNQGGKTTFVRTFGQLHHLASLGCPIPGRSARMFLCDRIFTHFEREENIGTLRGKLQDDLIRIHDILVRITPKSLVLMNEIFSSTTLEDAVFLATKVIGAVIDTDCLCVCVTFMDELASLHRKVVSMVSTVVPDDAAQRTFKIVRRPADGRAYAISIAEKYRLTDEWLRRRLMP